MAIITLAAVPVSAATMSASLTIPVVDAKDIANYGTTTSTDKWFLDPSVVGQTFTVGSTGVMLKAAANVFKSSRMIKIL